MRPLLVVSLVLFLIAAISAFSAQVNVNEIGFLALGLAAFVGDQLLGGVATVGRRPLVRPLARRGPRRTI